MTVALELNRAPALHCTDNGPERRLCAAYEAWRGHYERCVTCNREDYYTPERRRLCVAGLAHFQGWVRLALSTTMVGRGRLVVDRGQYLPLEP